MADVVEVRCPVGPQRLFTKLRLGEVAYRYVPEDNTIEFACGDCARRVSAEGGGKVRVLHRYSFIGELVDTLVEPRFG